MSRAGLVLIFGLICLGGAAGVAQSPVSPDRAQLEMVVAEFTEALGNNDFPKVQAAMPPRFLEFMARRFGVTPDELNRQMVIVSEQVMKTARIEHFSIDTGNVELTQTAGGMPFALLPTETIVWSEGQGRLAFESHTLAIFDDGSWYLLRVSDADKRDMLRAVYPDFREIEIPPGSARQLD